jgi:hypothetical protein
VWDGPNQSFSLAQARANFEQYLLKSSPDEDKCIGGPNTDREQTIKSLMITAFEQMMQEPTIDELNALWQTVRGDMQALDQELKVRVWGLLYKAIPCSYCGKTLRTCLAKQ